MISKKISVIKVIRILILLIIIQLIGCSEINNASSDNEAPITPKNFILLGGGDGQARFRWEKNIEPDFKEYRLYRSTNNVDSFELLISLEQVEYLDRFLDYESTYYYYITAIDFSNNESEASNTLNIQPLNISAPQPPSNFKVNPTNNPLAGKEDISLTWLPPDASDLNKYIIYRSTEEDFIPSNETLLSSTTTTFYIDNDAIINQKYYYRVTAVDNGLKESYPSLIESDSILSTPNLILPSNSTIFSTPYLFRWDEVLDAVSYEVFVGTAPLSTIIWSSGKTTLKETTYDGPPLQYNKVYYWWVVTYSKTGSANPNSYSIANSFFAE